MTDTTSATAEGEQGVAGGQICIAFRPARIGIHPGTVRLLAGKNRGSQFFPPTMAGAVSITDGFFAEGIKGLGRGVQVVVVPRIPLPGFSANV